MTRKLSSSRFCRVFLISRNLTGTMCLTAPRLVLGSPLHYSPCVYIIIHACGVLKNMIIANMLCFLGSDHWDATGGDGSEIYSHAGARSSMGQCEFSMAELGVNMHVNRFNADSVCISQDDGVSENDNQLSVAGKIKKHFNTGPKLSNTSAGVSVITVSSYTVCGSGAEGCVVLLDDSALSQLI